MGIEMDKVSLSKIQDQKVTDEIMSSVNIMNYNGIFESSEKES